MIVVAVLLWATLAASLVLLILGVRRRSGAMLLVAGGLSLLVSWASILSIGRFLVLLPLVEIALGAGYLTRLRTAGRYGLVGAATALYVAQWLAIWHR